MKKISINKAVNNLYQLISDEETLFLTSIPGFVDNINDIRKNENWDIAKEYKENINIF